MVPRVSYLAAAVEDSVNYFREYTAIIDKRSTDGVWFEHQGAPLKRLANILSLLFISNAPIKQPFAGGGTVRLLFCRGATMENHTALHGVSGRCGEGNDHWHSIRV